MMDQSSPPVRPWLVRAFTETLPRIPVWLMRQAGRYLPEYQAIRRRHSLAAMFSDPDVALDVSLQPLRRFDLDAAIVFMDILTPFKGLRADVVFPENGPPRVSLPYLHRPLRAWPSLDPEKLQTPLRVIGQLRKILPPQTAVIGFIGGPWTISRYVAGLGQENNDKTSRLNAPDGWFEWLADQLAAFIEVQIQAGADCLQVFDTWLANAPERLLQTRLLPVLNDMLAASRVPVIYFARSTSKLMPVIGKLSTPGLSVDKDFDWRIALSHPDRLWQGNLDPELLLPDREGLDEAMDRLLGQTQQLPHYVFNLAHGVPPNASIEKIETMLRIVRTFEGRRLKRDGG